MKNSRFGKLLVIVLVTAMIMSSFTVFAFADNAGAADSAASGNAKSAHSSQADRQDGKTDQASADKTADNASRTATGSDPDKGSAADPSNSSGNDGADSNGSSAAADAKGSAAGTSAAASDDTSSNSSAAGSASANDSGKTSKKAVVKGTAKPQEGTAYITYNFYVTGTKPVRTQIVKEGDTLYRPETPSSKDGGKFTGWFEQNSDTPFKDFGHAGEITEDRTIDLYARFENNVLVTYYDADGSILSRTAHPQNSEIEISPQYPVVSLDKLTQTHVGWTLIKGSSNIVSGKYSLGKKDIELYPVTREGYRVTFDSCGGTFVKDQFLIHESASSVLRAERPAADPEKQGYVFDGWFTDKSYGTEFDFKNEIKASTTVYAKWSPSDETNYTVNYWAEYPVGEPSSSGVTEFEFRKVSVNRYQGTTGENTQFDERLVFEEPTIKLSETGYSLSSAMSPSVKIAADGSAVMNVYYSRNTYTVTFTGMTDKNGQKYEISKTGKYGTSIIDLWDEMDSRTGLETLFASSHFKFETFHFDLPYSLPTIFDKDTVLKCGPRTPGYRYGRSFYESIDGESPDGSPLYNNTSARVQTGAITDDRLYFIKETHAIAAGWKAAFTFDITPLGFTARPLWSDGHAGRTAPIAGVKYIAEWFSPISDTLYGVNNKQMKEGGTRYVYSPGGIPENPLENAFYDTDGYLDLYYTRNKYDIIFVTNDDREIPSLNVYYEKGLSGYAPSEYVAGVTTKTITDGHVLTFGGWYLDPTLTIPFDFATAKMPPSDLYLYAKWEPNKYSVIFDSNGGSAVKTQENIEYGKQAAVPDEPVSKGRTFLGWVLDNAPYDFSQAVYRNITLIAQWKDDAAFKVTYDLNGGKGTAPKDSSLYAGSANAKVMAPGNVTAPEGKCFICWTKKDSDKEYYPGDMVELGGQDVTLYAKWDDIPRPTQLIYDFNFERFGITGVSAGIRTQKIGASLSGDHTIVTGLVNNGKVTLAGIGEVLNKTVRGYRFVGWHLAPDCSDEIVTSLRVDNINEEANIVYAEWEKLPESTSPVAPTDDPLTPDERLRPNDPATPDKTVRKTANGYSAVRNLSPATSDDSNISFWLIAFILSAMALAATALSAAAANKQR